MRAYRLAQVAVEAETIRWKTMASRTAMRAAFGLGAVFFLVGVVVFLHLAAWYGLRLGLEQNVWVATGALGGADLLIAIVFGVLASRSTPSRQEREALEVRRRAVQSIGTTFSIAQMAIPVLRLTNNLMRKARR